MRILCVGQEWRGSDASGLFYALSRTDHLISIVSETQFFPNAVSSFVKVVNRLTMKKRVSDFNKVIIREANNYKPDLILVYKGTYVLPETVILLKRITKVINFYPDHNLFYYGPYIPKTIFLYDLVFSTKTFTKQDTIKHFNYDKVFYIPHGFDPLVHRKLSDEQSDKNYKCDVSFIGTWTPKKENILAYLISKLPDVNIKIWGNLWDKSTSDILKISIQNTPLIGDLLTNAIINSKINIALLAEKVVNGISGDKITARTFQIPACQGFMLHERTDEVLKYYEEDIDIACFDCTGNNTNLEELVAKVTYYLHHEKEREIIAESGYKKTLENHSLDHRAKQLIEIVVQELEKV